MTVDGRPGCRRSAAEWRARAARWITGAVALAVALPAGCSSGGATPPENDGGIRFDEATGYWFGTNDWIEYRPGTLPVVLSAPHGGGLEPTSIPDRSGSGIVTVRDSRTIETTLAASDALEARTGARPHVVISHLRRTKLDPNRDIGEAALGNGAAEEAWREYHGFIEMAREAVIGTAGAGLYLDMHGHGHDVQRLELGYLLSGSLLDDIDDAGLDLLDGQNTSLAGLAARTPDAFSGLLRGALSFGGLLEAGGVPAVPSPRWPGPAIDTIPGDEPYFSGGYSTRRHGSLDGGPIDGIQIEHNFTGIRETASDRATYAAALAEVIERWIERWYGWTGAGE
jgi:hypothetical protein